MDTILPAAGKTRARPAQKRLRIGDRVTFAGTVLRVLPGDDRPLLIMVDANGFKLMIKTRLLSNGGMAKGGDAVRLAASVTRVGDSLSSEHTPISLAVDGWLQSRITLGAKSVQRQP